MTDSINSTNISASYTRANQLTAGTFNGTTIDYRYDSNLNISFKRENGTGPQFNYVQFSNKLSQFITPTYQYTTVVSDGNGNIKTDNKGSYNYDLKNNMILANTTAGVGSYTFNALNQRVTKTVNGVLTYFVYNENHQLIGEYDANGAVISEHVYFGLRPVGLYQNNQMYTVHTDYLGTPRIITNSGNSVVWKWLNLTTNGNNLPSVQTITYNLRYAGQYFDNESLLHYNYYRTYNPDTGRYMQSDPIGLAAGANTYNYVGGNPLSGVDPLGLQSVGLSIEVPVAEAITSKGLNVMRDTGHTFIWTKDLNGNITSLYSFGPKEHIGIFNSLKFFNGNMSGNSKYEIDSGNVNTWAWKLTESQYSQCIQNIEKAKNISKNYTVDNQCTSTSIALATSCGIMNMPSGVSAVTINTKSGYSLYNKNLPNPYGLYTQLSKFIKPVEESSSVYMKYNQ